MEELLCSEVSVAADKMLSVIEDEGLRLTSFQS